MLLAGARCAARCHFRCHSSKAREFAQELRKVQAAEQDARTTSQIRAFEATFPEIKSYAHDEKVRAILIDCEDMTWPRGSEYMNRMREPGPSVKKYMQSCIVELLENGVDDDLADFIKLYMSEKKLL